MKKFSLVFVLICLLSTNIFGQDKKHTIFFNFYAFFFGIANGTGPGIGIGYDYNINQDFSVGLYGQFYSIFNDDNTTFDIIVNSKYYPIKTKIGNPYINAGFGFRRNHMDGENFYGLILPVYFGFKFVLWDSLTLDPSFGFRYNSASFSGADVNHSFIQVIRATIGWIF